VIITTLLLILTALGAFLVAAAAFVDGSVPWATVPVLGETSNLVALNPAPDAVVGTGAIVIGVCALVVAFGFFRLTRWGWTGLMLLAAVSLSINLVAVVIGDPDEGSMAVAIAAVLYANQRRIQLLFRGEEVVLFDGAGAADVRTPR
jgi:hypothetical protein